MEAAFNNTPQATPENRCRQEFRLRFAELGFSGHVSNVSSLALIDEARNAFLGASVPGSDSVPGVLSQVHGRVSALVAQHIVEYRKEVWFRSQSVFVDVWIPVLGESSFAVDCALYDADDEDPAVLAESTLVLIDKATRKPWRMDPALREVLGHWSGERLAFRPRVGLGNAT